MDRKFESFADAITGIDEEISFPPEYKVILLNDDFTTKEFVVAVLMEIFHKNQEDAVAITNKAHEKGSAVVGIYSFDIASTRVALVVQNARQNGFPLQCELEVV